LEYTDRQTDRISHPEGIDLRREETSKVPKGLALPSHLTFNITNNNSMVLVHEQTIMTERLLIAGEVSAKFYR
jgi:hypothetical protein